MPKRTMPVALLLCLSPALATAQVPVGGDFRVNVATFNPQANPSVAALGDGRFGVVWTSDGHTSTILARQYDASGNPSTSEDIQITASPAAGQHDASVAADPFGRATVVWQGPDPGFPGGVFARHFGDEAAAEFQVNTYTTDRQGDPAVAAGGNGNFLVVWVSTGQFGAGTQRLLGSLYDASGAEIVGEFTFGSGVHDQTRPAVAADADGNFVVIWEGTDLGGLDIFGQRFGAEGQRGPEFLVNSYTTGSQSRPAVASRPNGDFVVVWESAAQDGSNGGVFGQRFLASAALPQPADPEFQVNAYTAGGQYFPAVAVDTDGSFVVAWSSLHDGDGWGVFGRRFEPAGLPGTEFQVSADTTGLQYRPSVAFNAATRFVVAWTGVDGSLGGVFARQFSTDLSLDVIFKDCFSPACP